MVHACLTREGDFGNDEGLSAKYTLSDTDVFVVLSRFEGRSPCIFYIFPTLLLVRPKGSKMMAIPASVPLSLIITCLDGHLYPINLTHAQRSETTNPCSSNTKYCLLATVIRTCHHIWLGPLSTCRSLSGC